MVEAKGKYSRLIDRLQDLSGVMVAFSGGVDSALLLHAAVEALGDQVLAVTIKGDIHSEDIDRETTELARELGARHRVLEVSFLKDLDFSNNPPERCYLCKKEMFTRMKRLAAQVGLPALIEGSNASDDDLDRPGSRAALELGVSSPLREVGLAKAEIRGLAQMFSLPVWNKPSDSCLCTRIPHGERIEGGKLTKVALAEEVLTGLGFSSLRVRNHKHIAVIEVDQEQIVRLVQEAKSGGIIDKLKDIGFKQVYLNLEGYRGEEARTGE